MKKSPRIGQNDNNEKEFAKGGVMEEKSENSEKFALQKFRDMLSFDSCNEGVSHRRIGIPYPSPG